MNIPDVRIRLQVVFIRAGLFQLSFYWVYAFRVVTHNFIIIFYVILLRKVVCLGSALQSPTVFTYVYPDSILPVLFYLLLQSHILLI